MEWWIIGLGAIFFVWCLRKLQPLFEQRQQSDRCFKTMIVLGSGHNHKKSKEKIGIFEIRFDMMKHIFSLNAKGDTHPKCFVS
jgi:hypothetical protein